MRILIVGGAGRMGVWLARYLRSHGHRVEIYDIDRRKARLMARRLRLPVAKMLASRIAEYDAVLLSVPPRVTSRCISRYARRMKEGQILAEVSSTKAGLGGALRRAAEKGLRVLSLHPFFGPATSLKAKAPLALVSVGSSGKELRLAKRLFPTLRIVALSEEEHERVVALSIWASYLACLSLLLLDLRLALKALEVAPPRFRLLLALGLSCLAEEPALYGDIRSLNPFAGGATQRLLELLSEVDEAMEAGGEALRERIANSLNMLPRELLLSSQRLMRRLGRELLSLEELCAAKRPGGLA